MKVFTSNTTWIIATLQKIGSMFLVTIGNIKKMFQTLTGARKYLLSMGY